MTPQEIAGFPGDDRSSEAEEGDGPATQGLEIARSDSALSGRFRSAAGEVSFLSVRTAELRAELSMLINGKAFSWINDDSLKMQTSTGQDAVLDAADREVLRALVAELDPYLTSLGDQEPQELFPLIAASYWMESPEGYVHSERSIATDGSVTKAVGDETANNGIVCVANNTAWTLPYTLANGTVQCSAVTVGADWGTSACGSGNYACMGRCGAGCSGTGGGRTMDCLEHDICSHNLCASGGGSDANCGDEYDDSYDDFTAHMWGGGRCASGTTSDQTPGVAAACSGGGSGGGSGSGTTKTPLSQTSVSGSASQELRYTLVVPTGGTAVAIAMSGGTGDADLYVKKGSAVSTSSYDCRPYKSGNTESCSGSGAGTYYIMVRGYSAFSGITLKGSYTAP